MDVDRSADAWDTLWAIPDSVVVDPLPVPAKAAVIRRVAPKRTDNQSSMQRPAVVAAPAGTEACHLSASALEIGNGSTGPSSSAEYGVVPTTSFACGASTGPVTGEGVIAADSSSLRAASSGECAGGQPTSSAGSSQLLCVPAQMSARPSVTSWPELAAADTQAQPASLQQQHSTAGTAYEKAGAVAFATAVSQAAEAAGLAGGADAALTPSAGADPHPATASAAHAALLLSLRNGNGSGGGSSSRTCSTSAVGGNSDDGSAAEGVSTDADSTRAAALSNAAAAAAEAPSAAASSLWTAASLRTLYRSRDPRLAAEPSPVPPAVAGAAPACASAAGSPVQFGAKAAGPAAPLRPLPPLPPLRRAAKTTTALLLNRVRRDPGSAACSPQAATRTAVAAAARAGGKAGGKGKRGKAAQSSIEDWIASSRPEAATGPEPVMTYAYPPDGESAGAALEAMRRSPSVLADLDGSGSSGNIMDDVQRALEAAEAAAASAEATAAAAGTGVPVEACPAAPAPTRVAPAASLWPPQRTGPLPPPRGRFDFRIRKRRARAQTPGASPPPPPMERSPAAAAAAAVAKAAATERRAFMDAVFASAVGASLAAADADAAPADAHQLTGQKRPAAAAAPAAGPRCSPSPALPVDMYTAADVEAASTAAAAAAAAARSLDACATLDAALDEWRTYRAPKVRKTPEALLRRSLLEELAARCPTSVLDLEEVPGLPRPWIRNYGQEVLDVCRNFLHVHAVRAAARQAAAAAARARRAAAGATAATGATAVPAQQRAQAPASALPAQPQVPPSAARQAAAASPPAKRQRLAGAPRSAPLPAVSVRSSDGSTRWVDERAERLRRQLLGAMGLQADKPIEPQLGVTMNVTPETVAHLQQQNAASSQQEPQQTQPSAAGAAPTAAATETRAAAAGAGSSSEAPARPRVATKAAIAARHRSFAAAAAAGATTAAADNAPVLKPAQPPPAASPRIRIAVSARAAKFGAATTGKPRASAAAVAAVGAAAEAALARGGGGWVPAPAGTRIRAGAALAYAPSPAVHYVRVTDLLGLLAEAGRMAEPFLEDAGSVDDKEEMAAAGAAARAQPPVAASAAKAGAGRRPAGSGVSSDVLSGVAGMGVVPAPALAAAAAVQGLGRVSGQEHMRQLRAMVAAAMPAWEVRRVLACKALGASAQAAAVLRVTHATPRAEVRMAFRRLSLAVHPDKNKSDSAAEAFAMVSAAASRLLGSVQC